MMEGIEMKALDKPEKNGLRITKSVPTITMDKTLKDVELLLKKNHFTTIDYIYVIDDNGKLTGVLPISALYKHSDEARVLDICRKTALVKVSKDKLNKAPQLAVEHNIKAVPVVDGGVFLGVVSNDKIFSSLNKKFHQTLTRMAGVHQENCDNIFEISLLKAFFQRIPWLAVGLIIMILGERVISSFEEVLSIDAVLKNYIPLLVYMAGAVSEQMNIFIIRDLVIMKEFNHPKYFFRQIVTGAYIAVFFALILFLLTKILYSGFKTPTILAISLLITISSASFVGLLVPYLFHLFKKDPAAAAGPLSTVIQDVISIYLYCKVAEIVFSLI